ncbi:MAG: hypothetical protein Q8P58_01975 [Candidatus Adlerbacteria bacterium]|nr:hypothetical protein [Candidatus Adlerbacteria bacterium]
MTRSILAGIALILFVGVLAWTVWFFGPTLLHEAKEYTNWRTTVDRVTGRDIPNVPTPPDPAVLDRINKLEKAVEDTPAGVRAEVRRQLQPLEQAQSEGQTQFRALEDRIVTQESKPAPVDYGQQIADMNAEFGALRSQLAALGVQPAPVDYQSQIDSLALRITTVEQGVGQFQTTAQGMYDTIQRQTEEIEEMKKQIAALIAAGTLAASAASANPLDSNQAAMGPPPVYSDQSVAPPTPNLAPPVVANGYGYSGGNNPPPYTPTTQGRPFFEVFGIPKGYRNAGARHIGKDQAQCLPPRHLVLDLNNCGQDAGGRWCANKCE